MKEINVAAIQMVSSIDFADNSQTAYDLIYQSVEGGAQWVVLPEYWPIMGRQDTDKLALAEHFAEGEIQDLLSLWAKQLGIYLFAGSIPLKTVDEQKVFNSLLVYNPEGECISRYDKMHLFGFTGLGEAYDEANTIQAGSVIPQLQIDNWQIAQGICYDLRFPEFFRAQQDCDVIILPAAFTYTTGQAHWEILLKARAIENQCYVIASAQGGLHQNGRKTFGHSMIIDPWGEILAQQATGNGIVMGKLNKQKITSLRSKLPALKNRKI